MNSISTSIDHSLNSPFSTPKRKLLEAKNKLISEYGFSLEEYENLETELEISKDDEDAILSLAKNIRQKNKIKEEDFNKSIYEIKSTFIEKISQLKQKLEAVGKDFYSYKDEIRKEVSFLNKNLKSTESKIDILKMGS